MKFYKSAEEYYSDMTSNMDHVDTSENSLIYSADMPVAYKLSENSLSLEELTKRIHAKSAYLNGYAEELEKFCEDVGIYRHKKTYAEGIVYVTGNPNATLPIGSLVAKAGALVYKTMADLTLDSTGNGFVKIIATDAGSEYNAKVGEINLFPIKYMGILTVTNKEAITNGYDDETIDSLYNRYMNKVSKPSTGGNIYDYENWALSISDVGYAKCIPAEEIGQGGIVKVIIADNNNRKANAGLIKRVHDYIESVRPVLAGTLQVITVTEVNTDITADVEIDTSTTLNEVENMFKKELEKYFKENVRNSKKISIAKIQSILMSLSGVTDCSNVMINGRNTNLILGEEEISVLNSVSLGVM